MINRIRTLTALIPAAGVTAAALAPTALAHEGHDHQHPHHTATDNAPAVAIVDAIAATHNASVYDAQTVVEADLALTFGSMQLDATLSFTPSNSKIRMTLADGTAIVYDGTTAWLSPADAEVPGPPPRFHVLTWPYFMAAPYKLNDPGTNHEIFEGAKLKDDTEHTGVKVTFGDNVGDTPDDWYIAIPDPQNRLTALAYIVTYGKDAEAAEASPSIILYDDFKVVDDVPFATSWSFRHWDPEAGITGEPKGSATLSNIRFRDDVEDGLFTKPDGAVEAKAPAGG